MNNIINNIINKLSKINDNLFIVFFRKIKNAIYFF